MYCRQAIFRLPLTNNDRGEDHATRYFDAPADGPASILAPRMIQSMEILQLPIMALQDRIRQELDENPVLELTEPTLEELQDAGEAEPTPEGGEIKTADPDAEMVIDDRS